MEDRTGRVIAAIAVLMICCRVPMFAVAPAAPNPELTSTVHSRTIQGFLMVAGVSINGQGPYNFLIDTGTNTTLIDPELAAELAMKPVDRMSLRTVTDSQAAVRYFADTVVLGSASIAHLETLATPLPELQKLDHTIRGVLGMNFLLHFSFELDYEHHRFHIFDAADSTAVPDGLRLKVRINDGRILVPLASSSAHDGSWYLGLDSGIAQLVVYQDRINLDKAPCADAACMMLVSTNQAARTAGSVVVNEIELAGSRFRNIPVVVTPPGPENNGDPQDGLLPASLFRSVYFHRADATLIVKPR
jgi:predicted aspartyl protease